MSENSTKKKERDEKCLWLPMEEERENRSDCRRIFYICIDNLCKAHRYYGDEHCTTMQIASWTNNMLDSTVSFVKMIVRQAWLTAVT